MNTFIPEKQANTTHKPVHGDFLILMSYLLSHGLAIFKKINRDNKSILPETTRMGTYNFVTNMQAKHIRK